jgi:hypothetical protein
LIERDKVDAFDRGRNTISRKDGVVAAGKVPGFFPVPILPDDAGSVGDKPGCDGNKEFDIPCGHERAGL